MSIDWDFVITTLAWLAARTETKIDDRAVELAQAIRNDPWLQEWLNRTTAPEAVSPDGTLSLVTANDLEAAERLFDGKAFKNLKSIGEVMDALREVLPYVLEAIKFVRMVTGK